jgi:hypothetical protein
MASTGKITVNALVKLDTFSNPGGSSHIVDSSDNSWHLAVLTNGVPYFWNGITYHTTGTLLSTGRWYMLTGIQGTTLDIYVNGELNNSLNSNVNVTTNNVWIGAYTITNRFLNGQVSNVQIYPRALTTAEIKQNYFGSPIVTDGLVFAVDANNIVSYPKSGTIWYGLTGSFSASLVNGPTFDPANGGSIVFDGTDDYVQTNLSQNTDNALITWECWYFDDTPGGFVSNTAIISNYGPSGTTPFTSLHVTEVGQAFFGQRNSGGSESQAVYSGNLCDGRWHHVVGTVDSTNISIYVDGVLQASNTKVTGVTTSGQNIVIGGNHLGRYQTCKIANARIYNVALTPAQIQQNYQAEQYRFGQNQGIVTGSLSLYLDASNGTSYPGSGTTWFDLSGNGNNVSLVNGPSFNTTNGFSYFNFDGSNDYGTTGNVLVNTAQYAIFLVFRPLNVSTVLGGFAGQNDFIEYGIYNAGGQGHRYYTNGPGALDGNITMYANNTWYIACLTNTPLYNGATNRQVYFLNGTEIVNKAYAATVGSQVYNFNIAGNGIWGPTGDFMPIDIAALLVYERGLDKAEVLQNYNYLRSLYGLNV